MVVVDNQDGYVKLEDYERNSFEVIAEGIEQLITTLRLKRQIYKVNQQTDDE